MKVSGWALFFLLVTAGQAQHRSFRFTVEDDPSFRIVRLVSTETLPCIGYGISTLQLWNTDTVIIDIRGFRRPTPCYTGMEVAREEIRLTGMRKNSFFIKFRWNKEFDLWKVTLQGNGVSAKPLRQTFTLYDR